MKAASIRPSVTMTCSIALSRATSVSALNCSVRQACGARSVRRGSATMILRRAAAAFFIQVAATGWLAVGLEPITRMKSACSTSLHRVADRARADAFEQRGHAGGMAQAGAVVHVVAAEAGAHQLLEQVGLFVAALGGAEAGQGFLAMGVAQGLELAGGEVQRLVPAGFAEDLAPVQVAVQVVGVLGHAGLADQRLGQARRVVRVVEAEAALDAQAAVVGRAVAAVDATIFSSRTL